MDPTLPRFPQLDRRRFAWHLGAAVALTASWPLTSLAEQPSAIRQRFWSPLDHGARGDGRSKDTLALQQAIDACASAGGGVVALDAGHVFLSGSLTLRPHVELHLCGGSILLASPDRADYHALGALLFAKDAEDIHISGTGVIDGNFAAFFAPKGPEGYAVPQPFLGPYDPLYGAANLNPADGRPRMILLVHCRGVLLEDFTIRDSPTWTIHPIGCEGVRIAGISILNKLDVPNCDGIDIDHCRQVRIEGCNLVAGDDCLVLKASRNFDQYGPCENISITNCTLESSSAGIKVEPEGTTTVRSVVVSNCSIVRSNRGISILNRDGATVEDMLFSGIAIETRMQPAMWWGSGEPIAVSSLPRKVGGPAGLVQGVAFVGIVCKSESGIYLRGAATPSVREISFRDVDLEIAKTSQFPGGFYDMRPGDALSASGLDRRDTAGFFAAHVDGLTLNGVQVHWPGTARAYYGSALELHDCSDVSIEQVTGRGASAGRPAAIFDHVSFAEEIVRRPPPPI